MTNKEAIKELEVIKQCEIDSIKQIKAIDIAIAALEEKEQEDKNIGCEFCKRFDFRTARTETDKYGARILLAGGVSTFPKEICFKFCPECGRKLP